MKPESWVKFLSGGESVLFVEVVECALVGRCRGLEPVGARRGGLVGPRRWEGAGRRRG